MGCISHLAAVVSGIVARVMLSIPEAVGRRVRALRTDRGWTQQQLADEMERLGFPWKRITVAEVEGVRRRSVSVDELLGLALLFREPVPGFLLLAPGEELALAGTNDTVLNALDLPSVIFAGGRLMDLRDDHLQRERDEALAAEEQAKARLDEALSAHRAASARLSDVDRRIRERRKGGGGQ